MNARERRLQALEAIAPARPDPDEQPARARFEGLTDGELDRLFGASLDALAESIRDSGSTFEQWEAEAGGALSKPTVRRLRALVEGEPENSCPVCWATDHKPGIKYSPHLLPDGSAPTWPYSAATRAAITGEKAHEKKRSA